MTTLTPERIARIYEDSEKIDEDEDDIDMMAIPKSELRALLDVWVAARATDVWYGEANVRETSGVFHRSMEALHKALGGGK